MKTIACMCGYHPSAFKVSPSLSSMTTHEMMQLIEKLGYKACEIKDDGNSRISIITSVNIDRKHQEVIEASAPAGVKVFFTIKDRTNEPLPKSLQGWARDVQKELKK